MNNIYKVILSVVVFYTLVGCSSHEGYLENTPAGLDLENNKTLLWELDGPGIKKPSYIFGTVHIISKNDYFFPDNFYEKLISTEELVLEIDMSSPLSLGFAMIKDAPMKGGKSLKDLLSREQYHVVKRYFTQEMSSADLFQGASFSMIEKWKPFFLMSLIDEESKKENIAAEAQVSYETKLMSMSRSAELELDGLESVSRQISVFDSIPYEEQAVELYNLIVNPSDDSEIMNSLYRYYKDMDIVGLYNLVVGGDDMMSEYKDILLDNRNMEWIPKIINKAEDRPTFFAVGVGHLAGERGVLQLLADKGYRLKPIFIEE